MAVSLDNAAKARELIFKEPEGAGEWLLHMAAKVVAYPFLYAIPKAIVSYTSHHHVIVTMEDFYKDLGGEAVKIPTEHGHTLSGFYFNAEAYQANHRSALTKWKTKLLADKQLSEYLCLNPKGRTLPTLFDIPQVEKSTKIKGALLCNGANALHQCDPNLILSYLARGISVCVFNYGGVYDSELDKQGNWANGKTTNLDGVEALCFLQKKMGCSFKEILVHGKSLGSSVAAFVGTQKPVHVIMDRPFSTFKEIATDVNSLAHYALGAIEKFYPFPSKDLLQYISGNVMIIRAEKDEMMQKKHTDALVDTLAKLNKPSHFIEAPGMHKGVVWYNDARTQKAICRFLNKA